jgi:hypothetical protein
VSALNHKSRTVLSELDIEIVSLMLSAKRKNKEPEAMAKDMQDCRDVLEALTVSGYAVVTQRAIDSMKKIVADGEL